jgi:murein DD-endopeptidase MepM/ murein hydrolase activator NlpD
MRALVVMAVMAGFCTGCSILGGRSSGPSSEAVYVVERGDTLQKIGQRFSIPAHELQRYNDIVDPRKLQVGQLLRIPAVGPLRSSSGLPAAPSFLAEAQDRATPRRVSLTSARQYVGALALPVQGSTYTSKFGWRWSKFHEGIDLAAPQGTKIVAAHAGRVVYTSDSYYGYGRILVVRGEGLMTVYGHNSRNRVSLGERVSKGDWIADVGQTGDASGPHLHFETRVLDETGRFAAVDPALFFIRQNGESTSEADL